MMRFAIVVGLCFAVRVAASHCLKRSDCWDGDPTTVDICVRNAGRCVNALLSDLPTSFRQPTTNFTTATQIAKEELIAQLNAEAEETSGRQRIISTVTQFVRDFNPHRFYHLNVLNVDVVNDLNTLSRRLDTERLTNLQFHEAMIDIFQRMDDRHMTYFRPASSALGTAALGFSLEGFYEGGRRKYVVTDVEPLFEFGDEFVDGVQVLEWNGVPVEDAIMMRGEKTNAANDGAREALGAISLVSRFLEIDAFPEEDDVKVTFHTLQGRVATITVAWRYFRPTVLTPLPPVMPDEMRQFLPMDTQFPIDLSKAPPIATRGLQTIRAVANRTVIPIGPILLNTVRAEIIQTSFGKLGWLTVAAFPPFPDINPLAEEYARVLSLMPDTGLIIDLRGNTGGDLDLAKVVLELISDVTVPDMPTFVRATPFLGSIFLSEESSFAMLNDRFERYFGSRRPAIRSALPLGEMFTGPSGFVATDLSAVRRKQVYKGPIIVVVDGRTYSAGDIFAAYIADTGVAELVGLANATGGGGATASNYESFRFLFPNALERLPYEVSFSTPVGRFFRTGEQLGKLVEGFGIEPTVRYYPTRDDILNEDCDLIEFLAERLVSGGSGASPEPEGSPEEVL